MAKFYMNLKKFQQNRFFLIIILLFFSLTSLYAGKQFYRIGNYTKVKILKVTAKGIQISHSFGISYITDEKLSESEKKLLALELEQYHKLKNIRTANIEKTKKYQTQEIDNLINRLPKMTWKELQLWSKKRIGVYLNNKFFKSKFNRVFSYAENKDLLQKALKKRITEIYNDSLVKLSQKLCKMPPDEINSECRRLLGLRWSDKKFRKEIERRYRFADNVSWFFDSVDKSIKEYRDKERLRLQEIAEKRKKEEEEKRQKKLQKIAEEKRQEEKRIQKFYADLKAKGQSLEDVSFSVVVHVEEVGGLAAAQARAFSGRECDFEYRIYVNDKLVVTRNSRISMQTFFIDVAGNSEIRADVIRTEGVRRTRLSDLSVEFRTKDIIANYPGKTFRFEVQ